MKTINFWQITKSMSELHEKLTKIENLLENSKKESKTNFRLIRAPKMLYSISELASLLGCSRSTAFRIKKSGKIPYYQINRKLIFKTALVLKSMAKGEK